MRRFCIMLFCRTSIQSDTRIPDVVFLSLKDVSGDTYESELGMMRKAVYDACQPHLSLLLDNPALLEEERAQFRRYAGKRHVRKN